ncbi:SAM-dependent methyltransferase [Desulfosarcina ovata subsp. sediminis]|uniref:SAM-dependent methyltransferase n=1 Tax=Desulfosarcina ovata subsp. sediminis TaxID=885957 RepID=A0A5K7ZNW4_9BACT|nr:class I SAM-dependent methyltransferase [Desulfosarcina ovata]BBO82335.1 SAM-dependent methyltransferase [Desulfosarcina ovata subsp. sediminis]
MTTEQMDWGEAWKTRMAASVAAMGGSDCARAWNNEASARNYWRMVLDAREVIDDILKGLPVDKDCRILDVGSGPGTLVVPLAPKVAHITAVEPAGAMADVLHENIDEFGLRNVDCVHKRWEEVDEKKDLSPPYDLVIASFSLGMPDIRAAIEKMQRVSQGYVFLLWFAGPSSWDRESRYLFKTLFDREYPGMPQADIIFNLLYQMGIYPHVDVFPGRMDHYYDSLDDMVGDFKMRMPNLSETQASVLRTYYEKIVEKRNGKVILPYTWQSMKLWWKKA